MPPDLMRPQAAMVEKRSVRREIVQEIIAAAGAGIESLDQQERTPDESQQKAGSLEKAVPLNEPHAEKCPQSRSDEARFAKGQRHHRGGQDQHDWCAQQAQISDREQDDVPRTGPREERERQVVERPDGGGMAFAEQTQEGGADGLNDPEQIENEQHAKHIVHENETAGAGKMRVIDVNVFEPGEQRGISAAEQQKE